MAQEFVSPHNLEDCARKLKTLNSANESIVGSTVVSIWKTKNDILSFSIRRLKYLNLVTQISGNLIYVSADKTKVVSKSSISLYLALMFIVYMIFGTIILVGYMVDRRYDLVPVALFGLGFGIFTLWFWDRWRRQLDRLIRNALSE